ncbi:hypothetical protein ACE1CD_05140 [Aerosakkonema sp. BLCC-F183]|uniref:hypothetical protein n=1 Tax=Aerosakkonema sp. BLCC-F183 TaxID=3342834 RepID=UPI0035BAF9E2
MPGGHASHKSTSTKPNTNTNGVIDDATDPTLDVEQLVDLGGDSTRLDEAPENAAAVERPSDRYKSGYDRD